VLADPVLVLIFSENVLGLSLYYTVCRVLRCGKGHCRREKAESSWMFWIQV